MHKLRFIRGLGIDMQGPGNDLDLIHVHGYISYAETLLTRFKT
jgi:hypothetical protein